MIFFFTVNMILYGMLVVFFFTCTIVSNLDFTITATSIGIVITSVKYMDNNERFIQKMVKYISILTKGKLQHCINLYLLLN